MDSVIRDVRYGFRQLLRQPVSSAVAVLALTLGIGLSTALFSVVDATILRPLPYPHPEQLVEVGTEVTMNDGRTIRPSPAMQDMRAWETASDVVSSVAGWGRAFRGRIVDGPQPERLQVLQFTESYLPMLGVTPILGRGVTRADCDPSTPLVALISYGYWRSHFGGRDDVLGQALRLDDETATIVGVLPAWFEPKMAVSLPLRVPPSQFTWRGTGRVSVYARLRPGITLDQARTRLSAVTPATTGPHAIGHDPHARLESLLEDTLSGYRTTVLVFATAVALILLIACVNAGGLLLARGAERQSEFAIRASIGADRKRLVRQLLTESLVLSTVSGIAGVGVAWLSLDAIVANVPMSLPTNSPVTVNLQVLAGAVVLLAGTALLAGVIPALRLSRVRVTPTLGRGGRTGALSRRGGQILIAAEVALALVLAAGAGLMIRSFLRIANVDLGFDTKGVLTMQVLPLEGNGIAKRDYYSALLERARSLPGVTAAGLVDNFELGGSSSFSSVGIDGRQAFVMVSEAMPGYLQAIGASLLEGRFPTAAQYAAGERFAVINESAARQMFPDGHPLGRTFTGAGSDQRPFTVVAVIGDMRHNGPLEARGIGQPAVFYPFNPDHAANNEAMTLVLRTNDLRPGLSEELRRMAASIGPRVLVERIRTADELFGDRVLTPRRRLVLLTLLGGLGLVLALAGVFAMTAYAVGRRTTEIGVRLAFGARPTQVVGTMLRDSAVPIVIGTLIGIGAALLATPAIRSFLFHTRPSDPLTLGSVAALLALTGCAAALIPSLRAARVDPATSLRDN
jgi:putative ABC transport system permease protein